MLQILRRIKFQQSRKSSWDAEKNPFAMLLMLLGMKAGRSRDPYIMTSTVTGCVENDCGQRSRPHTGVM
jgi:hypothetical protein